MKMKLPPSPRMSMVPPDDAIVAIGKLFAGGKATEADQLILCVLALMIACFFRTGEALTLPLDGWVTEGQGKGMRKGLKYLTQKTRGEGTRLAVRWLSPKQTELAAVAIERAKLLTTAARERARVLEEGPNTIPEGIQVVGQRNSTFQALSESLFVQFRNAGSAKRVASPLFVEPLGLKAVFYFLRDGKFFSINSPGKLRYWAISQAHKSGVPDRLLNQWMGRKLGI